MGVLGRGGLHKVHLGHQGKLEGIEGQNTSLSNSFKTDEGCNSKPAGVLLW